MAAEDAEDAAADTAGRRPLQRDLAEELDLVGNQKVHKTSSANIAIALNELGKIPPSLALEIVGNYLKAAQVQVFENRMAAPAQSSMSTHSRRSRSSRRDQGHQQTHGRQHRQRGGAYLYDGPDGKFDAYSDHVGRPPNPRNDGRGRTDNQGGGHAPNQGGGHGGNQEVDQPVQGGLRDHLSASMCLWDRIENSREARHTAELHHIDDYDQAHGVPVLPRAHTGGTNSSLRPFSAWLRIVCWPKNFKIYEVDTYDGRTNPEQWLTLYEIAVRAVGGSEDVMANYLPVVINQSVNQWLLSLKEGSIDT